MTSQWEVNSLLRDTSRKISVPIGVSLKAPRRSNKVFSAVIFCFCNEGVFSFEKRVEVRTPPLMRIVQNVLPSVYLRFVLAETAPGHQGYHLAHVPRHPKLWIGDKRFCSHHTTY